MTETITKNLRFEWSEFREDPENLRIGVRQERPLAGARSTEQRSQMGRDLGPSGMVLACSGEPLRAGGWNGCPAVPELPGGMN